MNEPTSVVLDEMHAEHQARLARVLANLQAEGFEVLNCTTNEACNAFTRALHYSGEDTHGTRALADAVAALVLDEFTGTTDDMRVSLSHALVAMTIVGRNAERLAYAKAVWEDTVAEATEDDECGDD